VRFGRAAGGGGVGVSFVREPGLWVTVGDWVGLILYVQARVEGAAWRECCFVLYPGQGSARRGGYGGRTIELARRRGSEQLTRICWRSGVVRWFC